MAIVAGVISYFYFKHKLGESAIDYWLAFLKTVLSFAIAVCFFSTFGLILDTVFLCYCDDLDGNGGVSYFNSDGLKKT